MEIWDLYDANDKLTGETWERIPGNFSQIPEGRYHMVCDILLQHADGTYLITQRDMHKDVYPGYWEASAGGSAVKGEGPLECAKRELFEETGVKTDDFRLISHTRREVSHSMFYSYLAVTDCDKDSIVLQEGETIAYKWVDKDGLWDYLHMENTVKSHNERYKEYFETLFAAKKRPAWLDEAVFYEIYPQSFKDTDGDGIGNINGITEKLEYIKGLGCNAIWINPCFESPFGDAGYDVSDYYKVAHRYGTNEDLVELFEKAHGMGMHILLDLVPGHTSWDHPWFKESMKAEKNEYTDRYIWTDNIWETPEGYGSLRGISDHDGSCLVNFFSHQPALNYGFYKPERPWQQPMDSEGALATRNEMKNVMRFWLSKGCDGFRVDMAGSLVKNDEDSKGTIALWQDVRSFLDKEFPEAVLVSEWGEPDKSIQAGFHMDFLLHFGPSHYNDLFRCEKPFFCGEGDASQFVARYLESYGKADGKGFICIPSGNHDMDRLAKYMQGDYAKMAFAFLLSMPGAPYIYYGDEIGMRYVEGLISVEGGYNRTGSRSPMQWNGGLNAGFSDTTGGKLYVPLDPDTDRPDVEKQTEDKESLLNEVKKLTDIRKSHKALKNPGTIEFICDGAAGKPLVYVRTSGDEKVLVAINPVDKDYKLPRYDLKKTVYTLGDMPETAEDACIIKAKSTFFAEI